MNLKQLENYEKTLSSEVTTYQLSQEEINKILSKYSNTDSTKNETQFIGYFTDKQNHPKITRDMYKKEKHRKCKK